MLVQETNLDVVTNNLANVDTVGYRRRISANSDFSALLDRVEKVSEDGETKTFTTIPYTMNWKGRDIAGPLSLAATFSETYMDTDPGVVRVTDNPLDVAINGPGFFSVEDDQGNTYYTRQGNFLLNGEGELVTMDGMTLQGGGGPIAVGDAADVQITDSGQVVANGEVVGAITLYTFENPTYLQQMGRNCLQANEHSGNPVEVEAPKLVPGAIEMANVSVVEEMVRMIEAQRAYEGASKALMTHDEETSKLITSFGKV
jgi:flagellar basal-body rod protein FlgG